MHEQFGALDVPQELCSESSAGVRAFDQSWNVGDHEIDVAFVRQLAQRHNAQVGLERGERVVGDLRLRRRDARDQRRLAHIWVPDNSNIGQ